MRGGLEAALSTTRWHSRRWVAPAFAVAVNLVALFLRRPDAFVHPQFWAEDGLVFFKDAHEACVSSLFNRYAGYLLVYPRAVAAVGCLLPVRALPALYNAFAVAGVLALCLCCFSSRLKLAQWQRVGMALAVSLSPTLHEVLLTLTNVQWVLALGLLLLLVVEPPQSRRQWVFDLGALAFLGLNGPFALIFSPLYAVRAAWRRTRYDVLTLGVVAGFGALQSVGLGATRVPGELQLSNPDHVRAVSGLFGQLFGAFGRPPPESLLGAAPMAVVGMLACGAMAYDGWRAREGKVLAFLGGAGLLFGSAMFSFRASPGLIVWGCDRYLYIPLVALVWAALATARRHRVLAGAVLVMAFVGFVRTHRAPPFADLDWASAARCIESGQRCEVPVNPGLQFVVGPAS